MTSFPSYIGSQAPSATPARLAPAPPLRHRERMRRSLALLLAACLALFGLGLVAYQFAVQPTVLRLAVGPPAGEDARLASAAAQWLLRERASLRLRVVPAAGEEDAAAALSEGKADLAVVRTDIAMPAKAQTMAIMHRDAGLLIAPERSGIRRVADLRDRAVGIVRRLPANSRMLETILRQYQIPPETVRLVPLGGPGDVEAALRAGSIDAAFAVGAVSGRLLGDTVAAVAQAGDGAAPVFVPVSEADAIALRSPMLQSLELVRGAFGGTPPRPAEALRTLGTSHRLVASSQLDDATVAEATRLLFTMRPALSADVPVADRLEGADTSKSSSLPVHPGAAAYYDGEVQTFFERYSDWIYLGIMALSIAGSALAGIASTAAARNRTRTLGLLEQVLGIVRLARSAGTEPELQALEREADEVLAVALGKAGTGGLDEAGISAFTLGLDQARQAISERRRMLSDGSAASDPSRLAAQ
jgi:TRAP transporter TAXI family solute receptor